MDKITSTAYEIQEYNEEDKRWEWLISFPTQEGAEECLHRTGPYVDNPPLITIDSPRWRIVKTEQIERSSVVVKVSAVQQGNRLVLP